MAWHIKINNNTNINFNRNTDLFSYTRKIKYQTTQIPKILISHLF